MKRVFYSTSGPDQPPVRSLDLEKAALFISSHLKNKSIFHISDGPRRSVSCWFATCFGTVVRGVRGKCGVSAVNSLSVSYTGQVGVQIWGGQKLQRWHDEGPRGYTVTPAPSSFSPARRVNSERGRACLCADLCVFSQGSVFCDAPTVEVCLWPL